MAYITDEVFKKILHNIKFIQFGDILTFDYSIDSISLHGSFCKRRNNDLQYCIDFGGEKLYFTKIQKEIFKCKMYSVKKIIQSVFTANEVCLN